LRDRTQGGCPEVEVVVVLEEFVQVVGHVWVAGKQFPAVRCAAFGNRLQVGPEDLIDPLFAFRNVVVFRRHGAPGRQV
jgi:hypothetical protein